MTASGSIEDDVRECMPKEVARVYIPIQEDVIKHHAKWDVFTQLYADSEETVDLLNWAASSVFRKFQDLIFLDSLLTLTRLTERGRRLSLPRLVALLEHHVNHRLHAEVSSDLEVILESCEPFKEWRDKLIAHKDLGFFVGEEPQRLPQVNRDMIDDANQGIGEMLNKIREMFGLNHTFWTPVMTGDGRRLIWVLRRAKKASARPR